MLLFSPFILLFLAPPFLFGFARLLEADVLEKTWTRHRALGSPHITDSAMIMQVPYNDFPASLVQLC